MGERGLRTRDPKHEQPGNRHGLEPPKAATAPTGNLNDHVVDLQERAGNRAVSELLGGGPGRDIVPVQRLVSYGWDWYWMGGVTWQTGAKNLWNQINARYNKEFLSLLEQLVKKGHPTDESKFAKLLEFRSENDGKKLALSAGQEFLDAVNTHITTAKGLLEPGPSESEGGTKSTPEGTPTTSVPTTGPKLEPEAIKGAPLDLPTPPKVENPVTLHSNQPAETVTTEPPKTTQPPKPTGEGVGPKPEPTGTPEPRKGSSTETSPQLGSPSVVLHVEGTLAEEGESSPKGKLPTTGTPNRRQKQTPKKKPVVKPKKGSSEKSTTGSSGGSTSELKPMPTFDPVSTLGDQREAGLEKLEEQVGEWKQDFLPLSSQKLPGAKTALTDVEATKDHLDELTEKIRLQMEAVNEVLNNPDQYEEDSEAYNDLAERSTDYDALYRECLKGRQDLEDQVADLQGRIAMAESTAAASTELTRLRGLWGSPSLAAGHFSKHKGDTGYDTEQTYLSRAEDLAINRSATGTLLTKTRAGNGDLLLFDQGSGEFSILSAAGKIRTLFCPSRGVNYFNDQS
jgi:hypothetical protein